MKYRFSILLFLLLLTAVNAQNRLAFTRLSDHKQIIVQEGQILSVRYHGYLGQEEFAKSMVIEITDTSILLDHVNPNGSMIHLFKGMNQQPKIIRIADIQAFRRITLGRMFIKSMVTIGSVIGGYILLKDLLNRNDYSVGKSIIVSTGIGLGSMILIEVLFPEKPKYALKDGWVVQVLH